MGETEKSSLGIVQIILHVIAAAFCLGNVIASAITLSTLNDLFGDTEDRTVVSDEEAQYRGVAGWLVFICVVGLIFEIIMVIFRALYFGQVMTAGFVGLGAVNAVFGVLFLLGLLAGGAASAANVADVQDFLDTISFACDNPPNELVTEICDNWEQLRNSIAAAAALSFLGAGVFLVLTIVTIVGVVKKRQESPA